MGHPRSPARFGVAVTSTGGAYDWRYPRGLPAVNVSGAGVTDNAAAPTGTASVVPVVAPTLLAPTFNGTTATIAFSGGSGYTTLIPQYSTDGTTWVSAANDTVSPFTLTVPSQSTLYYFRALPNNSVGYATNVVNATSGSGADAFGITTYVFRGLSSGLDMSVDDNTGGIDTVAWTGSAARITYNSAGTISIYWPFPDQNVTQVYTRFYSKLSANGKTFKHYKIFGAGYPSTYSNTTFSANGGVIAEVLYSDAPGGGDISQEYWFDGTYHGDPRTQTPSPPYPVTPRIRVSTALNNDLNRNLWEYFAKYNDPGVANGEYAVWFNGTLVLWMDQLINAGPGLAGRQKLTLGDFSSNSGWFAEYDTMAISTADRPVGRGI